MYFRCISWAQFRSRISQIYTSLIDTRLHFNSGEARLGLTYSLSDLLCINEHIQPFLPICIETFELGLQNVKTRSCEKYQQQPMSPLSPLMRPSPAALEALLNPIIARHLVHQVKSNRSQSYLMEMSKVGIGLNIQISKVLQAAL